MRAKIQDNNVVVGIDYRIGRGMNTGDDTSTVIDMGYGASVKQLKDESKARGFEFFKHEIVTRELSLNINKFIEVVNNMEPNNHHE